MNFRVGQKVVCITNEWTVEPGLEDCCPRRGTIYTVTGKTKTPGGRPALCLAELPSGVGALAINFRPAVEPDISVFTAMLKKTRKENLRSAKIPARERENA